MHECPQSGESRVARIEDTARRSALPLSAPTRRPASTPRIEWAEWQFTALGRRDAHDLAVALIASYQGIALLKNTFRDPELMTREARRLERWIDSLVSA